MVLGLFSALVDYESGRLVRASEPSQHRILLFREAKLFNAIHQKAPSKTTLFHRAFLIRSGAVDSFCDPRRLGV